MTPSDKIKSLVRQWEGLSLKPYLCPAGVWTVGYGHTGPDVSAGAGITQQRAEELFDKDCAAVQRQLNSLCLQCRHSLKQCQFDALFSFCYNLGAANLKGSTLWRKVCHDPCDPSIAAEFLRWVHSKGRVLSGLVKRREREAAIYAKGKYD